MDKKRSLVNQERAQFAGSSGNAAAGLSAGYRAT
jgi:hypothetical protein